ncbi:MAG: DNA mismatch repair protein MutS, partial [Bacteroidota bacterium]
IEMERFESPLLTKSQSKLNGGQASAEIKRLDSIAYWFGSRASFFYLIIGPMLMLDYHLLARAASWKNKQAGSIQQWFEVVDDFGAIAGIAGHAWLHPQHAFPAITEELFTLSGKKIGHPLLDADKRVYNDFSFDKKGEVAIITGSNMSGKSTFERTLGVNIVLAQLGAPVCADELTLCPMEVFTSMRTKDNLEESTSSFYAELKRLRQLLDHVKEHPVTFYVIDEVLKGTNSEDRYKGAVSLAKQLAGKNCFGLISTHDLSLSKLADGHTEMSNYSFNSTIEGDQIVFDYQLTQGPCRSFNASKLMENMGIIVDSE